MNYRDDEILLSINDLLNLDAMAVYDLSDDELLANLHHSSDQLNLLLGGSVHKECEDDIESLIEDLSTIVEILNTEAEARSLI